MMGFEPTTFCMATPPATSLNRFFARRHGYRTEELIEIIESVGGYTK
jgi:hypothetical protein